MKLYPVISQKTYNEWPKDHPARRLPIMPAEHMDKCADVVVCTIKGEPRYPPAADDSDVEAVCKCGVSIVHRASAPKVEKVCWRCFQKMATNT